MIPKVTVIGSVNLDITIQTNKFPNIGETIIADQVSRFAGGKGANQAVAAKRLGADVTFIGTFGDDEPGNFLIDTLKKENIDLTFSQITKYRNTGTAYIISSNGDNLIIVDSGANQYITCDYINSIENILQQSDIILLQLEIPLNTVWHICNLSYQYNIPVILNPAPSAIIPKEILQKVSAITPNEHEILEIIHSDYQVHCIENVFDLLKEKIIMTNGQHGVLYYQNNTIQSQPAYQVNVSDTTGAGDVFNGALATFWHQGLEEAVTLANAAASLSVTKLGAQSGSPTYQELKYFLHQYRYSNG
ncbi:MAG: ribokinase [Neisseriaceae bacterium]|nr:MAG: ribokinase [Neisseriaceae bacterium]